MYIDIPRAVYQYVRTQLSTIDSFMNALLMREILRGQEVWEFPRCKETLGGARFPPSTEVTVLFIVPPK